jgi:hypothetical protein
MPHHFFLQMIMIKMQNAGLFKHSEAGVCVKASDAISWLQQQVLLPANFIKFLHPKKTFA